MIIMMVHHFLRTDPYKMSIFERSVTELRGKFEDMFLVKIASKGTSLSNNFFKNFPLQ